MSNTTEDLIVFGEDWGALPSSTQHLIRHMKNRYRVLWVNSIGLRQPHYTSTDIKRAWKKIYRAFVGFNRKQSITNTVSSQTDEMDTINLLTIPAPRSRVTRWIAGRLMAYQLKRAMKERDIKRPYVWSSLPTADDVVEHLDRQATIYYCCDDFSSLQGVDHKVVAEHEEKLVCQSDLVITTSSTLTEKFSPSDTVEIQHGVDFKRFSTTASIAMDLEYIHSFFKHSVGFYGSIAEWVDIVSIAEAARKHPQWAFILIGEVCCDVTPLKNLANCFLLGPREHHELPRYSQHWDISMLPFHDNEQIRACNPLKLREYIAAGQTIFSTEFPALEPYRDQVNCGLPLVDFLTAYEQGRIVTPNPLSVKNESWSTRAQQICTAMEKLS